MTGAQLLGPAEILIKHHILLVDNMNSPGLCGQPTPLLPLRTTHLSTVVLAAMMASLADVHPKWSAVHAWTGQG